MTPISCFILALTVSADPQSLVAEPAVVQLGAVPAHKALVQTFRLKNVGPTPVTLSEVTGGCGCFRHQFGHRRLEPGQATEVVVGIDLLAQPEGAKTWNLGVRYSVGESVGEIPLKLSGKVTREVAVEPAALMLSAEGEITGTLTVSDRRTKPLTITGVRIGVKGITGTLKGLKDGVAGQGQSVEIAVAADLPPGPYAEDICLDTNDPDVPEIRVPLRVVKKAASKGVQAYPGTVSLRFAKDQATATSLVRLKDAGDLQVGVEKAEADHPGVTCKWAVGPDRVATLRVTVDRAQAPPTGIAVVTVKLTDPTAETILVPVAWGGPSGK